MIIKRNLIQKKYPRINNEDYKKLFNKNFIILDIETTGFSRKNDSIILIGLIIKTNDHLELVQIFAEDLKEEKELLLYLINIFKETKYDFFITYNGYAFDIPFINSRLNYYSIKSKLSNYKNFDIYRLIRKYHSKLNLKNYKLKTIEKFLNISRKDTISGKESIELYYNYLNSREKNLLDKILLHNKEDIKYLLPVLNILSYFKLNEILEFYPNKIENNFYIKDYKLKKNLLKINLFSEKKMQPKEIYDKNYSLKITANNILTLNLTVKNLIIENINYSLIHPNVYNHSWKKLDYKEKNKLIISINNILQINPLIENIKKILKIVDL